MSELAEGARLEIVCTSQAYRGFESHSLRHVIHLLQSEPLWLDSNRCFSVFCDKTAAIERFLAILADAIKNCIWTVNQQNFSFRSVNYENSMI